MKGFPDLPPIWALGAAAVSWVLARWVPVWRFEAGWLGDLVFWAGLALIAWSALWFWRKRTPIEPHHAPRALITEGPYRVNRNPIYTGLVAVVLGWAISQGAVSALLPAIALFPVLTARFIKPEEEALRTAFGAEADAWIARSRRW